MNNTSQFPNNKSLQKFFKKQERGTCMKMKWALLTLIFTIATVLTGCDNPIAVFDPKGPMASRLSDTILLTIGTMIVIFVVVIALFINMLVKYRASKQPKDYEPPHIEGSMVLETIWTAIPVLIVTFLSIVTVFSLNEVEATPKGYENEKPLVIYASSSDWKWHFSYPEENIETVNYLYVPVDRPIEFRIYAFGPISSFWIPQLAGQKYGMSDMVNTLHVLADVPGEYTGRNSSFTGKGVAYQIFDIQAVSPVKFDEWVADVKATAKPLTEAKFDKLLETEHPGRLQYTGTHLEFSPAPEGENAGHVHKSLIQGETKTPSFEEEDHSKH